MLAGYFKVEVEMVRTQLHLSTLEIIMKGSRVKM
jgi:hypothetical protein